MEYEGSSHFQSTGNGLENPSKIVTGNQRKVWNSTDDSITGNNLTIKKNTVILRRLAVNH